MLVLEFQPELIITEANVSAAIVVALAIYVMFKDRVSGKPSVFFASDG